jgi:hypothetical protein
MVIDTLISSQRSSKSLSVESVNTIQESIATLESFWENMDLDSSQRSLITWNSLYILNTRSLLKSASRNIGYSEQSIQAYQFAATQLYNTKRWWTAKLTRATIQDNNSRLEKADRKINGLDSLVKVFKNEVDTFEENINNKVDTFQSEVLTLLGELNRKIEDLKPKKDLDNFLIHTGLFFNKNQVGVGIGGYRRLKDKSPWFLGVHSTFNPTEIETTQIAILPSIIWNISKKSFLNAAGGITWGGDNQTNFIGSAGIGIIFSSKSYWQPKLGFQAYFVGFEGIGLQFVMPVGINTSPPKA